MARPGAVARSGTACMTQPRGLYVAAPALLIVCVSAVYVSAMYVHSSHDATSEVGSLLQVSS